MNYNIIHNNSLTIGSLLGIGIIITSYLFITNEDVHNDIINEDVQNDIINEEVKNDIVESYGNFVEIDEDDNEIHSNDKHVKFLIDGKKKAYRLLLNSMYRYLKHNTNHDFDIFLKKEWKEDYDIMIKSEENSTIKRDYTHWKTMFYNLKKKYNL
jgi:hypothetical protein